MENKAKFYIFIYTIFLTSVTCILQILTILNDQNQLGIITNT